MQVQGFDRSGGELAAEVPVAIIGAGPAGIAAAIQLKRMGAEPLVFERERVGGLLWNAHLVENYPGFPRGVPGTDLAGLMRDHLAAHSIAVLPEEVLSLDIGDRGFVLRTARRSVLARRVVIASGTVPRQMRSPEIPACLGDRVLGEVYPILDIDGRRVAIVGAGDAAFDYALSLQSRNAVVIINRGAAPRCIPILERRVESCPSIEHLRNTRIVKVERKDGGVRLACETDVGGAGRLHVDADYVILAIGRRPELSFLSHRLVGLLDELGGKGLVHMVGDVAHGSARQTAIAVGDGVAAAMSLHMDMAHDLGDKTWEIGR